MNMQNLFKPGDYVVVIDITNLIANELTLGGVYKVNVPLYAQYAIERVNVLNNFNNVRGYISSRFILATPELLNLDSDKLKGVGELADI